ncbi:hypothetical protein EKO24_003485 [Candidatus Methylobacter oryzae]|uniref:DUF1534 domain-containing protein n=1 Tax=Candidatus Methylobacter oryzae TaxID=2497749 RepID=A0ABY3CEI2_9GAMM|nr:hypothetical protein EKO24_003485 [Candidatus Methylobacter oryzae]
MHGLILSRKRRCPTLPDRFTANGRLCTAPRTDFHSRSHRLRGNAVKARCAASHGQSFEYTGRSASGTAFPRGAWERGKLENDPLPSATLKRIFKIAI